MVFVVRIEILLIRPSRLVQVKYRETWVMCMRVAVCVCVCRLCAYERWNYTKLHSDVSHSQFCLRSNARITWLFNRLSGLNCSRKFIQWKLCDAHFMRLKCTQLPSSKTDRRWPHTTCGVVRHELVGPISIVEFAAIWRRIRCGRL